jgi:hypothetical protein
MPRGQVTLLKYLYENERFVSTTELATGIRGGDKHSCISIFGPFSQRVNGTSHVTGDPGYRAFIETETRDGQTYYRLRDAARRVIGDTPALLKKFEHSMTDLRSMENPVIEQQEFGSE